MLPIWIGVPEASAIAMANARAAVLHSVEARMAARDTQLESAARRSRMKAERKAMAGGRLAEVIDLTALREARRRQGLRGSRGPRG